MMEGITIIVLEEILMANGLTVLMMWFLLFCRRKNRESLHVGDKIYDGIAIVNLVGALSETIAFLVDGKQFTGSRQINYRDSQYGYALVYVRGIAYLSKL